MAVAAFINMQGQRISTIECGQPFGFDVPGYTEVWLEQTKDGAPNFSGRFPVPMAPYTADCLTEPGWYASSVYEVKNGAKGPWIASTTLTVKPRGSAGPVVQCGPGSCPQPGPSTSFPGGPVGRPGTPYPGLIVPTPGPLGPGVGGGVGSGQGEDDGGVQGQSLGGFLSDLRAKLPQPLQGPLGLLLILLIVVFIIKRS